MGSTPPRTPQEVFAHHGQALAAGDLDEIVADYADDSFVITPAVSRAARKVFANCSSSCSTTYQTHCGT